MVDRYGDPLADRLFLDLPEILSAEDLLVFNNTRVLPARLYGELESGGAKIEVLLLRELDCVVPTWSAIGKPLKKLRPGRFVNFGSTLRGVIREGDDLEQGQFSIEFLNFTKQELRQSLKVIGSMPIPPYIRKGISDEKDLLDYQTHFAELDGSIAAPTASLHFTPKLLASLHSKKIPTEFVTLHVGPHSFLPLWHDDNPGESLREPGGELYRFDLSLYERLQEHRKGGGRVVAVGTTVVRCLESMHLEYQMKPERDEFLETRLFISPGYKFKVVDRVVTNFHQPATTHLLLVEAFIGRTKLNRVYHHALENSYRFLSYGDGMIIL